MSVRYILENLTGYHFVDGVHTFQILYQMWFIRDLMCMVVISPLIYLFFSSYWLFGRCRDNGIVVVWTFGNSSCREIWFQFDCYMLFSAGAYLSLNGKNIVNLFLPVRTYSFIIYPLAVVMDIALWGSVGWKYIHPMMIFVAIPFYVNLVAYMMGKGLLKSVLLLSSASFFVFAIHTPFLLPQIKKVIFAIVSPDSHFSILICYFTVVITTAVFAILIYDIFRKKLPGITGVLTGDRNKIIQ